MSLQYEKGVTAVLVGILIRIFPISCVDNCDGPCGCAPVFEEKLFTANVLSIETLFRTDRNRPIDPNRHYLHEGFFKGIWVSQLVEIAQTVEPTRYSGFFSAAVACAPTNSFAVETLKNLRIINKYSQWMNDEVYFELGQGLSEYFAATLNFHQEFKVRDFLDRNHRFQKDERI